MKKITLIIIGISCVLMVGIMITDFFFGEKQRPPQSYDLEGTPSDYRMIHWIEGKETEGVTPLNAMAEHAGSDASNVIFFYKAFVDVDVYRR